MTSDLNLGDDGRIDFVSSRKGAAMPQPEHSAEKNAWWQRLLAWWDKPRMCLYCGQTPCDRSTRDCR